MKMWYIVVVLALVAARLAAVSGQAISINFTTLPTTGQPINPYNAVAPAVMPSPLPSPSLPPPPPNPDLFVTPGQLNQAKQLNGMLFNSSLTVSSACSYSVLVVRSHTRQGPLPVRHLDYPPDTYITLYVHISSD